ncbi:peptidoglycan DD-metalloendopeptidase family protein [Crossiella sp. NPDC003009]
MNRKLSSVLIAVALAAGSVLASSATASAAGPRPAFQLPFPCGHQVEMHSFGHAPALDVFRVPRSATEGSPLVAPADGVVNQSKYHSNAGNMIQINHGGGWFTTYIHLQSRAVQAGQRVRQGQDIGRAGHTGPSSNGVPHLHFETAIDANGDGQASWGAPGTERVRPWFDGVEYGQANGKVWRVTSRNCGGDGSTQFADIDGDGKDEIIAFQPGGEVVAYHNVNGYGGYEGARHSVVARGFTDPARTKFADVNGDGRDEIIAFQPGGDVVAYHNVNGFGGYEGSRTSVVARGFTEPGRTRFADLDGDGKAEIISILPAGEVVAYHNVNGFGGYEGARNSVVGRGFHDPARTKFAEINGDRREELIVIQPAGEVVAYHNVNGFGGYEGARTSVIARGFTDPARTKFAEINGDGKAEIISQLPAGDVVAYHNVNGYGGYEGARNSVIARGFGKP